MIMNAVTLSDLSTAHDFEMLEHLEHDAEVPVLDGLQAQGDLLIIPSSRSLRPVDRELVPAEGAAVIAAIGGGHEHRLFAGTPSTAWIISGHPAAAGRQDIGVLICTAPAFVLHPEHGAAGIAPGTYMLRRQREQADVERLVAD